MKLMLVVSVIVLPGVAIAHAGRAEPVGVITLLSGKRKLQILAGSGILLQVNSSPGL